MKIIKYQLMTEVNIGTEEEPNIVETFHNKKIECPNEGFEKMLTVAKAEAYNGEYTIEDDGIEPVEEPTWQDRIEAQVTYTAMVTDSLILE